MKRIAILMTAVLFLGCGDELKKLSRQDKFPAATYEAFRVLKDGLERSPDNISLKLKDRYLTDEKVRTEKINQMNEAFHSNIAGHWPEINLTREDVVNLFGNPTEVTVGTIDKRTSLSYWILNKTCYFENGMRVHDEDCGLLRFSFSEKGDLVAGFFHIKSW